MRGRQIWGPRLRVFSGNLRRQKRRNRSRRSYPRRRRHRCISNSTIQTCYTLTRRNLFQGFTQIRAARSTCCPRTSRARERCKASPSGGSLREPWNLELITSMPLLGPEGFRWTTECSHLCCGGIRFRIWWCIYRSHSRRIVGVSTWHNAPRSGLVRGYSGEPSWVGWWGLYGGDEIESTSGLRSRRSWRWSGLGFMFVYWLNFV